MKRRFNAKDIPTKKLYRQAKWLNPRPLRGKLRNEAGDTNAKPRLAFTFAIEFQWL
jgi:hypothetical protein